MYDPTKNFPFEFFTALIKQTAVQSRLLKKNGKRMQQNIDLF